MSDHPKTRNKIKLKLENTSGLHYFIENNFDLPIFFIKLNYLAFETLWFHVKNAKYFIKNHEGKKSKIFCKVNHENILKKKKKENNKKKK